MKKFFLMLVVALCSVSCEFIFDNNASERKIYVYRTSVDDYKAASGWSKYADSIVGYDF